MKKVSLVLEDGTAVGGLDSVPMPPTPLMSEHDPSQQLGSFQADENGILVTFKEDHAMTPEQFFESFGSKGFQLIKSTEDGKVIEARIDEFGT